MENNYGQVSTHSTHIKYNISCCDETKYLSYLGGRRGEKIASKTINHEETVSNPSIKGY